MRLSPLLVALACGSSLLFGCGGGGATVAGGTTQPQMSFRYNAAPGAYYKDYIGPQRPALDVIATDGSLLAASQTISIVAKAAGPVFAGGPNFYVFGFRTLPPPPICFTCMYVGPFPDEPNVIFSQILTVTADPAGGGTLTGVLGPAAGLGPVRPEHVTFVAPDTIRIDVPAADLQSNIAADQVQWNVWARAGVSGTPAAEIASFMPDNAMATLLVR